MKVKEAPIGEVRPYPGNPRVNDGAVEAVVASLREFGWQQPIVVDADGTIIAGHTRYKAAKRLGMQTVPVVVASGLTPEQVQAYRLADNKVGELADWDAALLDLELDGLADFDMGEFGFEEYGFDALASLENEDFVSLKDKADAEFYNVTFSFPADTREKVRRYLAEAGKADAVGLIVGRAGEWG